MIQNPSRSCGEGYFLLDRATTGVLPFSKRNTSKKIKSRRESPTTRASPSLGPVAGPPRGFAIAKHRSGFRFPKNTDAFFGPRSLCSLSGRRESNPVYIHPMDAYYRHTPARLGRRPLSGRRESNPVLTNPNRMYYRHTPARYRTPPVCALQGSNLRPFACEANALTN